jgi:DNA polymerase III subunit gamma/tau
MRDVWALKYRPTTMSQLLGQEIPKRIIHGALKQPEFPVAFLVSGSFGGGKTSISRIIGRLLTCSQLTPDKEACGQCWNCQLDLAKGESPNYREQDAASAGHVDDVEELMEEARIAPMNSPRRVLVIDEAHALSSQAQNKMLKSLEEGIGKTCILLVTTNPEKLLPTIRSRCIKINVSAVDSRVVFDFLQDIVTQEGVSYEENALKLIVDETRGHIRNTLNLAYQISLYGSVTLEAVKKHLNLDLEDKAAQILVCVGESWEVTVQRTEELGQEVPPEDIWTAALRILRQAFLCVSQPSYRTSHDVKQLAEQHGMRLATVAEWSLGDGARLYVKTVSDLLVVFKLLRDKLGVAEVTRGSHTKRAGIPKSEALVAGNLRDQILPEETLVDILGLSKVEPTNTNGRPEDGVGGGK